MRTALNGIALLMLLAIWGVTALAFYGPHRLPGQVPTHFNGAGQPDAWGSPVMLWVLPVVSTVIYLLMALVARYPSAFNFPMRISPAARPRLEAIALNLLSWLRAEVVCLFVWIQYWTIRIVREGQGSLSPLFLPITLIAVFGTIAWYIAAMRRAARSY